MVDVGEKSVTSRSATAKCRIRMSDDLFIFLKDNEKHRDNLFSVCKVAGIMGTKKTSELIPMCHPISLNMSAVELALNEEDRCVDIQCTVTINARTGVEMEAMTGASVTALTFYDMTKSMDKAIIIESIRLLEKKGGKSGDFIAHLP